MSKDFSSEIKHVAGDIKKLIPSLHKAQDEYWDIQKELDDENKRFKELLEHYDSLKTAAILIREESTSSNDSLFYGPLTESECNKVRTPHKLPEIENDNSSGVESLTKHRNKRFILERLRQSYKCKNDIFCNLTERQKLKYLRLSDRYERIECQIIAQAELQKNVEELLIDIQTAVRKNKKCKEEPYLEFVKGLYQLSKKSLNENVTLTKISDLIQKFDHAIIRKHQKRADLIRKLYKVKASIRETNEWQSKVDGHKRRKFLIKVQRKTNKSFKYATTPLVELKTAQFNAAIDALHAFTNCLKYALKH